MSGQMSGRGLSCAVRANGITNRGHLRLVSKPEPTELSKMAIQDPDVLEFLRLVAREGLREEAIQKLSQVLGD